MDRPADDLGSAEGDLSGRLEKTAPAPASSSTTRVTPISSSAKFVDYAGIQDLDQPYGKIMRVRDDGTIPADNPFVKVPGVICRASTPSATGSPRASPSTARRAALWATEHGPRGGDELNLIRSGINYGWPVISEGVDYDGRPIHYAEELGLCCRSADPDA
ncbi:MAG: PQQ-dependent sugar dehydrogenase [Myxococcota bacterium]